MNRADRTGSLVTHVGPRSMLFANIKESESESSRQPTPDALTWRPLSLLVLLGQADTASLVTISIWFAVIGLCIGWGLYGGTPSWDLNQFTLFGLPGVLELYLPWVAGVLLVMWLGFEWAVIPVYLVTLFNNLHEGVSWPIAVANALHNPLGIAVFFLIYAWLPRSYALRSSRAWLVFFCAAVISGLTVSVGAVVWKLNVWETSPSLMNTWLGWWLNSVLLTLVVAAPVIFFLSPAIERSKQRYLSQAITPQNPSLSKLLFAASLFVLTLVLLILSNDKWQHARMQKLLATSAATEWHAQMTVELADQRIVVWILAGLLAAISLGGIVFAYYQVRRARARADAQARTAQDALRSSEARFRYFFQNNPAPMWVYDPRDGRFLEVNDAAVRQYGYTREEFLGMTIFDIRSPEEVARLRKIQATDVSDRNWEAGEWLHRRKDGGNLHVEVQVSSMRLDGRVVHLALIYDVTPRYKAQAVTEQRARELRILAVASLEIAAAQSVGAVLQISADRARQLTGANIAMLRCPRNGEAASDRHLSLAPCYSRWLDARCVLDDEQLYRQLTSKSPILFTSSELKLHPWFHALQFSKQGLLPLNSLLAVPLTAAGASIGILAVSDKPGSEFDAQDQALLTQLAQIASVGVENLRLSEALRDHMHALELRVAERTAELDSSNRELDAFAYSVAHDLRAPLRAMHGFANAVLEDYAPVLDDSGRNYLARVIAAAHNMDTLIQDLLAYSRIGRAHLVLEAVPLDEAVRDALEALAGEVKGSQARVNVDVPPLLVEAHRATLKQVILNLVSNAIKFVAAGVRPEISIQARAENSRVHVTVTDNGIGIAPEHRERIFNVFERLHGAETYPGTGVGLSIVKKGLARMHGEISVQSGPGGSVFTATLKEFARE